MNISTKIGTGYGLMIAVLLLASGAGFMATSRLSQSLDFLMGPAWDTADGGMEGRIAIQQQVIELRDFAKAALAGKAADLSEAMLTEADTAFARMFEARLLDEETHKGLQGLVGTFTERRKALIESGKVYREAHAALVASSNRLSALMVEVEAIGDKALESLAGRTALGWSDVQSRWEAASGTMETRNILIEQMLLYRRMTDGLVAFDEAKLAVEESAVALEAQVNILLGLDVFYTRLKEGPDAGRPVRDVLQKLFSEQSKALSDALAGYAKFSTVQAAFAATTAELLIALDQLEEVTDGAVEGQSENISAAKNGANITIVAALLIGLAMAVGGVLFSIARITRPLSQVATRLDDIANGEGDLTVSLPVTSDDEIGEIAKSFNVFVQKIRDTIAQVGETTSRLSTAAEELAAVTTQTHRNVAEQQAETDQVATAMNEMAATVREVAKSTVDAANAAGEANTTAENGRRIVETTINTINDLSMAVENAAKAIQELEAHSENIGSVLEVIQGVAEQTNLLALNAAIEAARAGEQGRGFAVVADEVRTLAERTQKSTQEIHAMIETLQAGSRRAVSVMEQSQAKAEHGVRTAAEAGHALQQINAVVRRIHDLNGQIASAAEEQSSVAEEMDHNISRISQISEETASGASQTARASEELSRLAQGLQQLVGQFRT